MFGQFLGPVFLFENF